jgi:cytochrome c553
MMLRRILLTLCLTVTATASAQQSSRSEIDFFESKIRPVLVTHCYECHSTESGKARGGLKVDSQDGLRRGGDSGAAVVPKSLDKSLLYQALLYRDDGPQMPPKGKLPQAVIDDFRKWIQMGAPDPRVTKVNADIRTAIDINKGREFWAYQPLLRRDPPQSPGDSWARTPIDRFVIAKLKERNLKPVADATPQTLIRRLYFTLIGLPPMLKKDGGRMKDELLGIEFDPSDFEVLVDRLLDSPQFGEHWGRHWLDVARFAESTGGDHNNIYQHAWRYRDYVINAFNADKPFDQFIREQIAGDLLPIANDAEWANNVIATGFLAIGVKSVGEEDQQKFFADLVDEQIDTTTRAFMATTVACARCHDHKFDPIPQEDYYALAGIFRSTETHYGLLKAQARQATTLLDLTGLGPPPGSPPLSKEELAALTKARDDAARAVADAMIKIRGGENVFRGTLRRLRSQRDETEAALQAYSNSGQPRVFSMGTQDRDAPLPTRLLVRGELDKPAQLVPRGVLQVLSPPKQHLLSSKIRGSGRLELAEWIASPQNPLTARVIANRVWHWMVGRGLVRTVDDFGHAGERPTHPELLDYLAARLIEENWSIKSLIREIALSRTWQLASAYDEHSFAIDPDNTVLWRMNQRRLEAEAARDAMLAVSGRLDLKRPLGTYLREVGEGAVGLNVFEPVIRAIESNTRSIYLPRVRSVLPEMLETFDAPDASFVTGSRDTTSSPLQALFLLNNRFVQDQAVALADRLSALPAEQQIAAAYDRTLGRSPTEREGELAVEFISRFATAQDAAPSVRPGSRFGASTQGSGAAGPGRGRFTGRSSSTTAGASAATDLAPALMSPLAIYCQALLCSMEFLTVD